MLSTLGASLWAKNIQFSRFNAEGANNKLLWRKFTTDFTTPYNESAPGFSLSSRQVPARCAP